MPKKQRGFSLIELLIVIAIILIIASIAIPSLVAARRQTNETAAVGAIRAINTAQISYVSAYPAIGFASTLAVLGGTACSPPSSASACLIDSQTASGIKHGYSLTVSGANGSPNVTYQIIASPTVPNQTGVRYFCSFSDGVARVSSSPISVCDGNVPPV
jgi:prepilin-type N-terminal cleavage/methylation domain-containing protein